MARFKRRERIFRSAVSRAPDKPEEHDENPNVVRANLAVMGIHHARQVAALGSYQNQQSHHLPQKQSAVKRTTLGMKDWARCLVWVAVVNWPDSSQRCRGEGEWRRAWHHEEILEAHLKRSVSWVHRRDADVEWNNVLVVIPEK